MDMKPNDNPERSKKTKESDENQNMLPEEKTSFVEQGSANKLAERRRRTPSQWFRKYFLEGQTLENEQNELYMPLVEPRVNEEKERRRRRRVAIFLPLIVSQVLWWSAALKYDYISLYKQYWQMPSAMIIGSTIAGNKRWFGTVRSLVLIPPRILGMTSEAGGAVGFPVMTFVLKTPPEYGRDFSLLIQSFGMGMATFTIIYNRIQVDWHAISFAVVGSIPGAVFGFRFVDPLLSSAQKKMIFVSFWTSFAVSLWILNREKKRRTVPFILNFCAWKGSILLVTGFVGGIFTAFAGSGVDICLFSIVTLLFSLTEKTATPSTIVSMALTSWFSVYWRIMISDETPVNDLVWNFIKCSVPVCTIMAPLGSFLGSHFHRQVLAHLVYICEFLAMLGFLFTRPSIDLIISSLCILTVSFFFFSWVARRGKTLLSEELEKLQSNGGVRRMSVAEL